MRYLRATGVEKAGVVLLTIGFVLLLHSGTAWRQKEALRGAGINVVAIHNHIETESPRIVFLHYWGVGSTTDLAKGLKAALDTQKK